MTDEKRNLPALSGGVDRRASSQHPAPALGSSRRPSGTHLPVALKTLGDVLLRNKTILPEQLQAALERSQITGKHLDISLSELGILEPKVLRDLLAKQYNVPTMELGQVTQPDEEVLKLVPRELCERYRLVPISCVRGQSGTRLIVAITDPGNFGALDDLRFKTDFTIDRVAVTEEDVAQAIVRFYQPFEEAERGFEIQGELEDLVDGAELTPHAIDVVDIDTLEKSSEDAPIIRFVNLVLVDAIQRGASDVHFESYENEFRVRYRIDGILYEMHRPNAKLRNAIVSRIKIMSRLDISERRLPQDGRMKMRLPNGKECDFRVSVAPFLHGEKVVLRLLDKSNLQTDMTKLGFDTEELAKFSKAIHLPFGMVLVTGPTGSGKTTSLYSALHELNKTTENISTVEDPVEFYLRGINQMQIKDDIGLSFAAALRTFLRQDPDIIMVGEVRDFETAEIAIKAALTGHMVLSTLHTNDAPSTISRLLNMGVEPFLVAASLNLIAAQRLVRRVCPECKTKHAYDRTACLEAGLLEAEYADATFQKGFGCALCSMTGFKGRVAIYEIMPMTDALREAVLQGSSVAELKRTAVQDGMQTLRRSALKKFAAGLTTLEEVLRVTRAD